MYKSIRISYIAKTTIGESILWFWLAGCLFDGYVRADLMHIFTWAKNRKYRSSSSVFFSKRYSSTIRHSASAPNNSSHPLGNVQKNFEKSFYRLIDN